MGGFTQWRAVARGVHGPCPSVQSLPIAWYHESHEGTTFRMNPLYYSLLHVFALFVLVAHTFMAFASPAVENKKRTMIITGMASLLVLVSGFGLVAKLHGNQISGWIVVKIVCWLGLSSLAGIVYRRPELRGTLALTALVLILVSLLMVYVVRFAMEA
jgi:uncharacterized membrane protein YhaH (DUF805 family)